MAVPQKKSPEPLREMEAKLKRGREHLEQLRRERQQVLRRLLEEGWTQTELASELGVTRTRIYQYLLEFPEEEERRAVTA